MTQWNVERHRVEHSGDTGLERRPQLDPATGLPRKLDLDGTIKSYGGLTTTYGNSCATPDDGVDTCCSDAFVIKLP